MFKHSTKVGSRLRGELPLGFTLVEMLVVVGVTATLASLLLPAISKAKEKARGVECLNNQRQILLGHRLALDEEPGDGLDELAVAEWYLDTTGSIENGWICPNAPIKSQRLDKSGQTAQGYVDSAWVYPIVPGPSFSLDVPSNRPVRRRVRGGSYGLNGYLFFTDRLFPSSKPYGERRFLSESRIEAPSMTPLLGDSVTMLDAPTFGDRFVAPPTWVYGSQLEGDWHGLGQWAVARHGNRPAQLPLKWEAKQALPGAINLGYFDGHAELVRLEDLWQRRWHNGYEPSVRP